MDQIALVENQLKDGWKLVELLVDKGFEVWAAAWIKTCDAYQWELYLVSPAREKGGANAYRRVHTAIRQVPQPFWVGLFDVKVLDTKDRLAKAILTAQRRYTPRLPNFLRETQLGDVSIDGAYLYPPVPATAPGPA